MLILSPRGMAIENNLSVIQHEGDEENTTPSPTTKKGGHLASALVVAARSPPPTYRRERSAETCVPVAASLRTVTGNRVCGRSPLREPGEASAAGPRLLIAPKVTGGDSRGSGGGESDAEVRPEYGCSCIGLGENWLRIRSVTFSHCRLEYLKDGV
ncbi:hypothetical protein CEXT_527221 [Caerostris extrusa]|uniref:Uncharacterized protein n=1 Tax=Caerostris extrusa TaxID=172846 RepID=A0AAV4RL19_CAEEX|nr:hypothetical protein CEXT_527221 [Caerostris extrusa]